jgi:hypothetical protein
MHLGSIYTSAALTVDMCVLVGGDAAHAQFA